MALTRRQKEVLDFIASWQVENGYSPSYEEIARGLNLARSSTTSNETFGNPASAALSRARLIPAIDRSIPRTCPADPTSLAVRNETSPTPHPQSSTFIPVLMPARCITCSVISPISRDWLTKRRSSHSASPKTYSWVGAAGSFSIELCRFIGLNRRSLLYFARIRRTVRPMSTEPAAVGQLPAPVIRSPKRTQWVPSNSASCICWIG